MKKPNLLRSSAYIMVVCMLCITVCSRKDDLQKGVEAIEKGDYAKALKTLRASLIIDSLNPDVHYNMSLAYAYMDSIEQACRHYYTVYSLGSPLMNDVQLKELLARALAMDPYLAQAVPMKNMNQFKGVFSPDGRSIAVAAAKRDIANIYVVESTGKIIMQITKRGMNTDPDFSPTDEYIAFASDADGDDDVYLYNIQTKEVTNLTNNTAKDFSPSFSPDGKEIVFISNRDNEYRWEIYRMEIASQDIKRLTNNTYWDGFPKFTPDGKKVIFSSKRDGSEDIYIMNKNGSGEKILYATESDENDPQIHGDYLYFKSNQSGEWVIYRYNMETEDIMALTKDTYPNWNPRISLNGSRLTLARKIKNQWRLYYMDLEAGMPAVQIAQEIEKKFDISPEPEKEE
ncbi:PD40 domain-containing protein [candidate division WOR-3 bacterium]|nr:PD40 domain-containing protein [candidate division WOR-3 bacterium]